jgi:hypothetical protein
MSSYLQQSYLGNIAESTRPEGFLAQIGWGIGQTRAAVNRTISSGISAVATGAKDLVTGTDEKQRAAAAEAERQRAAAAAAAAAASKASTTRNLLIVGALAAGAYFYFKRK